LSEPAFDAKAELINTSLTGNANFPLPWPVYVPQLADISTARGNYHTLYDAAQNGDSVKIAARNAARDALTALLKRLAPYLELVANGDVVKLKTTGYDLRNDIAHSTSSAPLPAPTNFRFTRGYVSGTMSASADSLAGAGSYELNVCLGDPAVEANWKDKGTFLHCSDITVDAFTPGTIYYARLRGIGSSGPGVWAVSPGVMAV
jgi:hypothetical protein